MLVGIGELEWKESLGRFGIILISYPIPVSEFRINCKE